MDSKKDLANFISENKLPCYVYLNNDSNDNTKKKELYAYKVIKSQCFIAKSYSRSLEKYLLNHRHSTASSLEYLTWHSLPMINEENIEFNEISIPLGYKGKCAIKNKFYSKMVMIFKA